MKHRAHIMGVYYIIIYNITHIIYELFVMVSEGRILQQIARVVSIYCRIDYKLDLSNRHEIVLQTW